MEGFRKIGVKIFTNKIIVYIGSRYLTYFIQFVNSIFIAVYLGPFYLGIWGFINLTLQYIGQLNLGIPYSVNAIVAINKNKERYVERIIGSSISMLLILSILVLIFFVAQELLSLNIGAKYNFSTYAPMVVIIGILSHFNTLFSSVFRIYGRLFEIAFSQTFFPVLMLFLIFFFKGENLLWVLVYANFISIFVSFILYIYRLPVKIKPILNFRLFKTIQIKGWHLFVYNTSFYLIIISTRSFVSGFYSVSEFGYFTFAFSLVTAISLLLDSFAYLIYPKLLNLFSTATPERVTELLNSVRNPYIYMSHLLVHVAIMMCPLFFLFFPKYLVAEDTFKLIALTQVLGTNTTGYIELLITKGKEQQLGKLTVIALVFNVIMNYILIEVVKVPFTYAIFPTMITYLIYVLLVNYRGRKLIKSKINFFAIIKDVYPLTLFIPYILSLNLMFFHVPDWYFIFPVILFIVFNHKILVKIIDLAKAIIIKPTVLDL